MRVGVIGISHKLADLKRREQLAKSCQKYFGALSSGHDSHQFVLLSTCNRTEVYFSSADLASTHVYILSMLRREVEGEFEQRLYSYFQVDCFHHLTRVALGLDSAIVGETEIQGQVKLAYESALSCHELHGDLHFLFQKAMGVAKRLRSEISLGRGMPNLEHAILQIGNHLFPIPENIRLLFVGASDINEKILLFLKKKSFRHITLCNRSDTQANYWGELHGTKRLAWSQLHRCLDYDWIIFGTKSPRYLITQGTTLPAQKHNLIMDLCVPRNVEPALGERAHLTLLNIDQINRLLSIRRQHMAHTIVQAEKQVLQAVRAHAARHAEKSNLFTDLPRSDKLNKEFRARKETISKIQTA